MYLPSIGNNVPRRGGRISSRTARFLLSTAGWSFEGEVPNLAKFVVTAAPHTSNWDFVLTMLTLFSLQVDFRWIGKHTLFRRPFGPLMRWLGGTPIDRAKPGGIVGQVVRRFQESERFVLAISPEGTRSKVKKWKAGFHRIARDANVPIVPAYMDFGRKIIGFGSPFLPGPDADADIERLTRYYRRFSGKRPDRF